MPSTPSPALQPPLNPAVRIRFTPKVLQQMPLEKRAVWAAVGVVALSLLAAYVMVVQSVVNNSAAMRASYAQPPAAKRPPDSRQPAPLVAVASPR